MQFYPYREDDLSLKWEERSLCVLILRDIGWPMWRMILLYCSGGLWWDWVRRFERMMNIVWWECHKQLKIVWQKKMKVYKHLITMSIRHRPNFGSVHQKWSLQIFSETLNLSAWTLIVLFDGTCVLSVALLDVFRDHDFRERHCDSTRVLRSSQ